MIGIGIVGYGYWGPNLARNIARDPGTTLVAVCDRSRGCLDEARIAYPGIILTTEYQDLLTNPAIDAIVVATPVSSHFLLAQAALCAGKHVLEMRTDRRRDDDRVDGRI